jgi:hypothetical protein
MVNLNNALASLQTSLDSHWSSTLAAQINSGLSDQDNLTLLETELLSKVEPILANLFADFNKSVIEGEYANSLSVAKKGLEDIETHMVSNASFDVAGHLEFTAFSQAIFAEKFINPARNAIKDYRRLLDTVEKQLNFEPQVDVLFRLYKNDNASDISSHSDLRLFKLNIQVALIDHSLSFDNNTFRKLIMYRNALSNIAGVGSVSDILKIKCNYLISKLAHRFDSEKTTKYAIDFQYHSFNIANPDELKYYEHVIRGHYDDNLTDKFKSRYKAALTKFETTPNQLTFDDYHALIKYFKDIKPSLKNIRALRVLYENFYNSSSSVSDFDKKTREITYCYLENNVLSLELAEKQFTIDNWEDNFAKYTDKADTLKNSNFFPYFKIIDQFLKLEINSQFKLDEINYDRVNNLINAFETNLHKLSENLSICENFNYLAFQLDYSGCKTNISDVNGINWDCFIASSFVLPMDYRFWRKTVEALSSELLKFKALRDLRVSLKKDITEIYDVKNKLAESDKRHIEILSIFSAIVLFVSNEVQLFSHLESVADAVLFTLFFAYALGLFVILIWFVTRPSSVNLRKLPITHYILIGIFLLGFIAAAIFLFNDSKSQSKIVKRNMAPFESKIDSLKHQIQIDSLKAVHKRYSTK